MIKKAHKDAWQVFIRANRTLFFSCLIPIFWDLSNFVFLFFRGYSENIRTNRILYLLLQDKKMSGRDANRKCIQECGWGSIREKQQLLFKQQKEKDKNLRKQLLQKNKKELAFVFILNVLFLCLVVSFISFDVREYLMEVQGLFLILLIVFLLSGPWIVLFGFVALSVGGHFLFLIAEMSNALLSLSGSATTPIFVWYQGFLLLVFLSVFLLFLELLINKHMMVPFLVAKYPETDIPLLINRAETLREKHKGAFFVAICNIFLFLIPMALGLTSFIKIPNYYGYDFQPLRVLIAGFIFALVMYYLNIFFVCFFNEVDAQSEERTSIKILNNLNENVNIKISDTASSESEIKQMLTKSPIKIPNEYPEIIRERSELEIDVCGNKILRIWSAAGCIELNEAYNIQKYLSQTWAIGDDEGGYTIIYAKGESDIGLYAVSFSDLDDNEKIFLAPSLYDFLVKGIGVNTFLEM